MYSSYGDSPHNRYFIVMVLDFILLALRQVGLEEHYKWPKLFSGAKDLCKPFKEDLNVVRFVYNFFIIIKASTYEIVFFFRCTLHI